MAGAVLAATTVGLCMAAAPAMIPATVSTTATTAAAIDLVDDRGRTVRLAAPARRIISLLPSSTETVCALGGCDRLVGVDRFSNWPLQVERLPRLGGLASLHLPAAQSYSDPEGTPTTTQGSRATAICRGNAGPQTRHDPARFRAGDREF